MLFHFRMSLSNKNYNKNNFYNHDWLTNCLMNKTKFENGIVKNMFENKYSNIAPGNIDNNLKNSQNMPKFQTQYQQTLIQGPEILPHNFGNVTDFKNPNLQNISQNNNRFYPQNNTNCNF